MAVSQQPGIYKAQVGKEAAWTARPILLDGVTESYVEVAKFC